ncbi:MAG: HAD family phosphatase [Hydrogenibacillus sp.]|nr:HAD family phosphatase [Hydrogenibacillus sp.]
MAAVYRMVFIDLDGTTLTTEKTMTPRTRAVLDRLERVGISVVIATGRAIYSVRELFHDVPFRGPVITLNGAVVFRGLWAPVWHMETIDTGTLREALQALEREPRIINILLESPDGYFVRRFDEEVRETFTEYRKIEPRLLAPEAVREAVVTNMLVRPDDGHKDFVHDMLQEMLGHSVSFAKTSWTWLEGLKAGVSKATAMRVVAERASLLPACFQCRRFRP